MLQGIFPSHYQKHDNKPKQEGYWVWN